MVEPGTVLGGKYRVGRTLGRGAMGVIFEAKHLQLGTLVAVKVLRKDYADKPDVAERFLREARAAAQLRGEHICRVHDYGAMDDGTPFMVMELLEGCDLGTLVDQEGALPPELVANCIVQTCTAIAEPHSRGMIHRDLKPTNLFLEQRGDDAPFIKILDFGIAKFEHIDGKLTSTMSVVGSPSYMAPEQLRSSGTIDARTDIWALGIVMYELLTESQPFIGESITDLALAITTEPPLPFATRVPDELADIVLRCLEKDPAQRYRDVAELAAALAPFAKLDASHAAAAARMLAKPRNAMAVVDELLANQTKHTTLHGASGAVVTRAMPRATLGIGVAIALAAIASALFFWRGESTHSDRSVGAPTGSPVDASAPPDQRVEVPTTAPPPDATDTPDAQAPSDAPTDDFDKHRRRKPPRPAPDLGNSRF